MGAGTSPSGSDVAHRGKGSQFAKGAVSTAPFAPFQERYSERMCRNIRTLHNFEPAATEAEVSAAALQYVRKISGFTKPSHANEEAFAAAVDAVATASMKLLGELTTVAAPKNREVEAAKARARAAERYAA
jgi:hypothetical protein